MGVQLPSAQNVGVASTAQDPGLDVPGAAFGTLEGGGLEALGGVGVDVADRFASREEATARSKARLNINRRVTERYREINDQEDWAEKGVSDQFAADVDAIVTEETEAAGGRWGSQERLLAQAEEIKQGWIATAATDVARRKVEIAEEARDDQVNSLVAMIDADPSQASLDDAIERVDTEIMPDLAPLIPAGAETEQRKAIVGMLVTAAANRHLMIGDTEGATAVLDQYALKGEIDTLQHLRTRNAITVAAYKKDEAIRQMTRMAGYFEAAGFSKKDSILLASGHAPQRGEAGPKSFADKVRDYEIATGTVATPEVQERLRMVEIQEALQLDTPEPLQLTRNNAPQIAESLYDVFRTGTASDEQARTYMSATDMMRTPYWMDDPRTGEKIEIRPELTPHHKLALEHAAMQGFYPLPAAPMPAAPMPAATSPRVQEVAQGSPEAAAEAAVRGFKEGSPTTPAPVATPAMGQSAPAALIEAHRPEADKSAERMTHMAASRGIPVEQAQGSTLWALSESAAGLGPAIKAGVEELPLAGPLAEWELNTFARDQFETSGRDLALALQKNKRYATSEIELLQKMFQLDAPILQSAGTFRTHLISIGDYVRRQAAQAYREAQGEGFNITPERRVAAGEDFTLLVNFLDKLGAPKAYFDDAELEADIARGYLRPGDLYADHNMQLQVLQSAGP